MNDKNKGLYGKYKVERVDGKPIKDGCIVLEFNDPIARKVIFRWARYMRDAGHFQVYEDVLDKLAATYPKPLCTGDYVWLDDDQHWKITIIFGDDVTLERCPEPNERINKSSRRTKRTSMLSLLRRVVEHPQA